jgi:hypothetical protein
LDIIFISYKEPNAEVNYQDLLSKFPHAKRVHGVRGIYEAYYKASKLNESDCFITVDGDTVVWDNLKDIEFNFTNDNQLIRYPTRNSILDIIGTSGSIKCWTKNTFNYITKDNFNKNLEWYRCDNIEQTHENVCVGETVINSSTYQAFCAGFREAFKIHSLFGESKIDYTLSWCVKREVKNGKSCAFGARLGFLYAIDNKISLQDVNDFKFLEELFTNSNIENYIDVTNELKEKLYQKQYKIKITKSR